MGSTERFPLQFASLPCLGGGRIGWREAGAAHPGAVALVLLHGIGSGAASWQAQFEAFGSQRRVLAWDAPGYGESAALPDDAPLGADYALALSQWLAAAGVQDMVLVGHSLGALMAAAWAADWTAQPGPRPRARLRALVLACPARGYGRAEPAAREAKWRERIEAIERHGPAGLAAARAANLCTPDAPAEVVEHVRANMARITPRGYAQAAHLLAHDDLASRLGRIDRAATALHVIAGALDRITPPEACAELAREAHAPFTLLPGAAHACYVEQPAAFDDALARVLATVATPASAAL
ncbi:MAG: alpha/beta fold hydrolase [Rubrivivax sp.]|nr:alpha/beta fold hydrolase [Rubrivivax sp.]